MVKKLSGSAEDLPVFIEMLRFKLRDFHLKPGKQACRKFVKLYNEFT